MFGFCVCHETKKKTKTFQMTLVGTPNVTETADSSYADYADNFDLSLLSMDNDFNSIVNGMSVFFPYFVLIE